MICKKPILLCMVISLLSLSILAWCEDAAPAGAPAASATPEFLQIFAGVPTDAEYNLTDKDSVPALQGLLSAAAVLIASPDTSISVVPQPPGAQPAAANPPSPLLDAAFARSIDKAFAGCKRLSVISYSSSAASADMMPFYVERLGLSKGWMCSVKNKALRVYSKLDGQGMFGMVGKNIAWRIDGRVEMEAVSKVAALVGLDIWKQFQSFGARAQLAQVQAELAQTKAKLDEANAKLEQATKPKPGGK